MKRSVLIVEPSEIIYKGITAIINDSTNLTVLPQLDSLENIETHLAKLKPDLAIVNPTLFSAYKHDTANISEIIPDIPVIALVYQYVEASALHQYKEIIDIRDSAQKIAYSITNSFREEKIEDSQDSGELSDREKDVLVLIAKGQMSKEIAENLNISIHTVISHRKNIIRKTGIKSIAGLVAYALLNNLVDSSEFE